MEKLIYLFLFFGFVFSFFTGLLLAIKPRHAIELQRIFYTKINWRMEPIFMDKEIRNTRIMGIFLIAVAIVSIIFVVLQWLK
jgi:hypothetical protein